MADMTLLNTGHWQFQVRGGPCDGIRFTADLFGADRRDRRWNSTHYEGIPDGWRMATGGVVKDIESDVDLVLLTDADRHKSHHEASDLRSSLERFFATEALVRCLERENAPRCISHYALSTLRTVRPDFPEPPQRVLLWPQGEWTDDLDHVWVVHAANMDDRRSIQRAPAKIVALRFALEQAKPAWLADRPFTQHMSELERFGWYRDLPYVATINANAAARKLASSNGLHVVRNLSLEVRARFLHGDYLPPRRIPTPMWLVNHKTLVVREGYTPTVETLVPLMRSALSSDTSSRNAEVYATQLLGQAGERETHAAMERQFEEQLQREIGDELIVRVSIAPRETADSGRSAER